MPIAIVISPLGRLFSTKPTKYEMAEIYLGKYLTNSVINFIEQGKYFYHSQRTVSTLNAHLSIVDNPIHYDHLI